MTPRGAWTACLVGGFLALCGAISWWAIGRPSDRARLHAALLGQDPPSGAVAGPIVLAIIGAFAILVGVILYASRRG